MNSELPNKKCRKQEKKMSRIARRTCLKALDLGPSKAVKTNEPARQKKSGLINGVASETKKEVPKGPKKNKTRKATTSLFHRVPEHLPGLRILYCVKF
jgi:hypothetical protein